METDIYQVPALYLVLSMYFYYSDSTFQMSKLGFREILKSCLSPQLKLAAQISFDCKSGLTKQSCLVNLVSFVSREGPMNSGDLNTSFTSITVSNKLFSASECQCFLCFIHFRLTLLIIQDICENDKLVRIYILQLKNQWKFEIFNSRGRKKQVLHEVNQTDFCGILLLSVATNFPKIMVTLQVPQAMVCQTSSWCT